MSLGGLIGLCVLLVTEPHVGLTLFWHGLTPLLPLVFVIAPGLWRNVCPVAALNQSPRLLRLTRPGPVPRWVQRHGYLVGVGLFVLIVATRSMLFESNGPALAALLVAALGAAFLGGLKVKGKSGWCTTFCPLVPVERLYGQAPFVTVRNSHCQPCVGCTRHCYDLKPGSAHLADRHDMDRVPALRRRLFAAVFPGLTLWLFISPHDGVRSFQMLGLALLLSAGAFFIIDAVAPAHRSALPALSGAVALNIFYAYTGPASLAAFGVTSLWPAWALQIGVLVLSVTWFFRCLRAGHEFDALPPPERQLPMMSSPLARQATATRISSGISKFE